jgi:hypothetical protein
LTVPGESDGVQQPDFLGDPRELSGEKILPNISRKKFDLEQYCTDFSAASPSFPARNPSNLNKLRV